MKCPLVTNEMFPPPLDLLRKATERTEAHPAAVGMQHLLAIGNMVGRDVYTSVAETRHGTNQNGLVVGPTSSGRKGDAWNIARAPLREVDPSWFGNVSNGLSSGEGLIHAVRDAHTIIDKKTGEEEIDDPGVPDKRLLVVESEFSAVLKHFRRDSNILSNILRQAWDGDGTLRTLVKTSPTRATDAHITVIGHATREDLREYLSDLDVANGLANRFLFVACERPQLVPSPKPIDGAVKRRLTEHVRGVVDHARGLGHIGRTPRAERAWCELYPKLSQERFGLLGALLARGPAHVTRLSVLFAVLAKSKVIDIAHLTAAAAWWEYCAASAAIIFAGRTGNDVADRVRSELLPGQQMTISEIRENLFSNKVGGARLRDGLDLLRQLGEVELSPVSTGGRPAMVVKRLQTTEAAA